MNLNSSTSVFAVLVPRPYPNKGLAGTHCFGMRYIVIEMPAHPIDQSLTFHGSCANSVYQAISWEGPGFEASIIVTKALAWHRISRQL